MLLMRFTDDLGGTNAIYQYNSAKLSDCYIWEGVKSMANPQKPLGVNGNAVRPRCFGV